MIFIGDYSSLGDDMDTLTSRAARLLRMLNVRSASILPLGSSYRALLTNIMRGAWLVASVWAVLAALVFVVLWVSDNFESIGTAGRGAAVLMAGALGMDVTTSSDTTSLLHEVDPLLTLSVRPLTITLIVWWLLVRRMRSSWQKSTPKASAAIGYALQLGAGMSLTVYGSLYVARGLVATESFTGVMVAPTFRQLVVSTLLTTVLTYTAGLRARTSLANESVPQATPSRWSFATAAFFSTARAFTRLALLVAVVYVVTTWLRPDFVMSSAATASGVDSSLREMLPGLGVALLAVPNVVILAIMSFFGVYVTDSDRTSSYLQSMLQTDAKQLFFGLIACAVLAALMGGAKTVIRGGVKVVWSRDLPLLALYFGILGTFFSWLASASYVERALIDVESAAEYRVSATDHLGAGLGSVWVAALATAGVVVLGGSTLLPAVARAIPGWVRQIGMGRLSHQITAPLGVRLLVIALVGSYLTLPLAWGATERTWALIDSPRDNADAVVTLLSSVTKHNRDKAFGKGWPASSWLDEQAMQAALPDAIAGSQGRWSVTMLNSHGDPWRVGQLDAVARMTGSRGDQKVTYEVKIDGVKNPWKRWDKLLHAKYKETPLPITVDVSAGRFYPVASMKKATINGVSLPTNSRLSVPGFYSIVAPAYGIIAATNRTVASKGEYLRFEVGNEVAIPANTKSQVGKVAATKKAKCKLTKNLDSPCYAYDAITWDLDALRADLAGFDYDEQKTKKVTSAPVSCKVGRLQLISAFAATQRESCSQKVQVEIQYIKRAEYEDVTTTAYRSTYVEDSPGYMSTRCVGDYDYWGDWDPCYTTEDYYVQGSGHYEQEPYEKVIGQRLIAPQETRTVTARGTAGFVVRVSVTKEKSGIFTVK